jgi:formylglycine-generating enzyme required for sulfatase activity
MAEPNTSEKLKIFISYSRRDSSDFADELLAGLELAGFAPFLDRHDIAPGEKWEERLGGLIEQADTVLFVVSPEAVKSERCQWEVDKALAESKRVLPVVWKPVPETDIPAELRSRQFLRFNAGTGFARPLAQLSEALRQDLEWIREHTRLAELATRWQARRCADALLLRGDDVTAAQEWAERWKSGEPEVTEKIRAFIAASKKAELTHLAKSNKAQRRIIRMQALVSLLLVLAIVSLVGWINQAYIADLWRWYTSDRPFATANVWPYVLGPQAEQGLRPGDTFRECAPMQPSADYCPDMVVVPAGIFEMGSPQTDTDAYDNEFPQHRVIIAKPFAVARFEMTFGEWDTCVAYGGCTEHPNDRGWGRGEQPLIFVSWDDAQQYVAWLSKITDKPYRLLSESEYEYAARAGTTTAYPWGQDIGKNNANCISCGSQWDGRQPAPVGSFSPNEFGLYDMVGNVWEWVQDCYHINYKEAPTDGSAWIDGDCGNRVVRGGSWYAAPDKLRSANRSGTTSVYRDNLLGFRIARTLTP